MLFYVKQIVQYPVLDLELIVKESHLFSNLRIGHIKFLHATPLKLSGHSGLASGQLGFYKLFQNEWKPKNSKSPLQYVSDSDLICLLPPNTLQDTAI